MGTMKRCPIEIISQHDNPDFSSHHLRLFETFNNLHDVISIEPLIAMNMVYVMPR